MVQSGFSKRPRSWTRVRLRGDREELEIVRRTKVFVEMHYREPISLRDVAAALNYSAAHLTHTFRMQTGSAVTAWIIKRRIRAAVEIWGSGDAKVIDVCERVGFNDLCYFTRQFAKLVGMTPGRFRIAARESPKSLSRSLPARLREKIDCTRHISTSSSHRYGSISNRSSLRLGLSATHSTYRSAS